MMPLRMLLCLTLIGASIFSCPAQVIDQRVKLRVEQGVAQSIARIEAAADTDAAGIEAFTQRLTGKLSERDGHRAAATDVRTHPELATLAVHAMLRADDTDTRLKVADPLRLIAAWAQGPHQDAGDLQEAITWLLLLGALDGSPEIRRASAIGLSAFRETGPPTWSRGDVSPQARDVCIAVLHHLARDSDVDVRAGARAALFVGGFGPFPPEWDYALTLGLFAPSAAAMQPVPAVLTFGYAGIERAYVCPYEVIIEVTDVAGETIEIAAGPPSNRPNPGIQQYDEKRFPEGITPLWAYELGDVDAWVVPDILAGHEPLPPGEYQVRARVIVRVYHTDDVEQAFVIREGENPPIWGAVGVWEYEFALTSEPVELTVWGVE